jgi:septal ring factor EnvC (AmiA/AmiB activator)
MMNRVLLKESLVMVLMALISFSSPAMAQQTKKSSNQRRTTTVKKTATKKAPAKKTPTPKPATSSQPVTVNSLKNEQQKVRKQIEEQQRKLKANERDVKKRLQNLLIINNEIADKRKSIDTIRHDINRLDGDITTLEAHIKYLDSELEERKQRFIKSMRYMHRNRNMQSKLMFIFSAKNLTQMYRRLRFVREYAAYQQTQAEAVKSMKTQVAEAFDELTDTKRQKSDLLVRDEQERRSLEGKQVEQQKMVTSLQKQQKTIQSIIDQQKKRDAELNAQIDRLIAQEIARAKARAEAEARKKAAEAEAKRKAEELARKKAAAEAARKENERRIAEAKAKEEKAKADARAAAARKNAEEKAAAERAVAEAERARLAAERKASADAKAHEKEVAEAKKSSETIYTVSSEDRQLSGNFESNRGRLPMPITGSYRIVNHFGTNHVTDVKGHVTLDKKGIDIKGQPGAAVRCIFDGEVSAVFSYAGTTVVIVRHGSYLSVYCDLASVNVSRGQKVSTRQTLGRVGAEGLMQFQLRKGSAKLNPEGWLAR